MSAQAPLASERVKEFEEFETAADKKFSWWFGYRQALDLIHSQGNKLPISEATIRQLHALSRHNLGDAGEYKQANNDVLEILPDGRRQIRFRTVPAADTAAAMTELIQRWHEGRTSADRVGRVQPTWISSASIRSATATAVPPFAFAFAFVLPPRPRSRSLYYETLKLSCSMHIANSNGA